MKWTSLPRPRRDGRKALAVLGTLTMATGGLAISAATPAAAATGTTYYVSTSGSDANSGTSSGSPWKTLAKVNATTFQPGDQILFQDADTWTGQLWPKGSGTSTAAITIGSYGSGAKPAIAGAGAVPDAVKIWDQQYWTITNLDVSNNAGASASNLGDFRGIHIGGDDSQTLSGFTINAVNVHDVTGVDDWIGGSTSNNKTGINFQMGWDRAKDTGGIVFNTTVPNIASPPSTATILNNITIENSSIENTSWGGIVLKQYTGDAPGAVATGWGVPSSSTDSRYAPFTNVTIEGNYITQQGTAYGSNGILIADVRDSVVQNNLINQVGTCGIELDYSDVATVQHNEVTGTTVKAGGGDSNGIDTDMGTTNMTVQYNYLHNNDVGFLVYQIHWGNSVWRYNIITNSSKYSMQLGSVSSATAQIYNNTFYNTSSSMAWLMTASNYTFTDDIFYTTVASPTMASGTGVVYNKNLYGGTSPTIPSGDAHAITGDPQFANPTAGGTGTQATGPDLSAGLNWQTAATSPAANAGVTIANNGGIDYNGATVPTVPDIGALQHSTSTQNPVFKDTFDSLATGALATGTDGWAVTSTGNAVNVVATPSSTDKSVELVRTANTGGTPGTNITHAFSSGLTGNFSVSADVMRDSSTSDTGYFCLPYLYNSSGTPVISVAFSNGEIEAYEGTTLTNIESYTLGSWYHIEVDVDTASQTFTLYVNGVEKVFGASFRASAPSINSLAFYANSSNYGDAFVNNVTVS